MLLVILWENSIVCLFCETVGNTECCLVCDSCNELTEHLLQAAKMVVCAVLQDYDQTHSFIYFHISTYRSIPRMWRQSQYNTQYICWITDIITEYNCIKILHNKLSIHCVIGYYKLEHTLFLKIKKLSRRNFFKVFLNTFVSFTVLFMEVCKWLKALILT